MMTQNDFEFTAAYVFISKKKQNHRQKQQI